jgi:hypothetical protein
LEFENLPYKVTHYSNNRKNFQRFETCEDIFKRHNVTGQTIGLGIQMLTFAEFANLHYKHHIYSIRPPVLVYLN